MDSNRLNEISELVSKLNDDIISFDEFDSLVSEDEYNEWSVITTRGVNNKVDTYLNSKKD